MEVTRNIDGTGQEVEVGRTNSLIYFLGLFSCPDDGSPEGVLTARCLSYIRLTFTLTSFHAPGLSTTNAGISSRFEMIFDLEQHL